MSNINTLNESFRKVEIHEYLKELCTSQTKIIKAIKISPILVESINSEGLIETLSLSNFVEYINFVPSKKLKDVVLAKKLTRDFKIFYNKEQKTNCWIIDKTYLNKHYTKFEKNIYIPKKDQYLFIQVLENIEFLLNGSKFKLFSGGYLNISNREQIYGIQKNDFLDTYQIVDD